MASPEPQVEADCEPRELPVELWSTCLQTLFLHHNQLRWLPNNLGKLSSLTRLDISS